MSDNTCQLARVWAWKKSSGGASANTNHLASGITHKKTLPVGKHPLQLYLLDASSEQRVTIILERLLAQGVKGAEYDAWIIRIGGGDQFSSGFVKVSPNSKIPALRDHSQNPPVRVFESDAILLYLTEKYGYFLPQDLAKYTETLNWLFWLQGMASFLGDGFGHFYNCAPVKIEYAINHFAMEAGRLFGVLNKQLAQRKFVAGDEHTITDMAAQPWPGSIVLDNVYNTAEFLDVGSYKHVQRWVKEVTAHPAVERGRVANHTNGPLNEQLHERHDASDFDTSTEDKRQG